MVAFLRFDKKANGGKNLQSENPEILLIGSDNPTTWIIYNHLIQTFGIFPAMIEPAISKKALIRNRIHKLGVLKVASQVAFVSIIRRYLERRDAHRVREICRQEGLEPIAPITTAIIPIESVNSEACREHLRRIKPRIVIVNGTRIIKRETLNAVKTVFINTHQGITPMYRGAHGAYWALLMNDRKNCGVTIHKIDEGIDTGDIIEQARIEPTAADSFVTYPFLQTAAAVPLLTRTIGNFMNGKVTTMKAEGQSAIWYHPGFFQYIYNAFRGVR
jgi:methionyl-tRNA formyltransferase